MIGELKRGEGGVELRPCRKCAALIIGEYAEVTATVTVRETGEKIVETLVLCVPCLRELGLEEAVNG